MLFVLIVLLTFTVHSQNTERSRADQYLNQKGEVCFQFTAKNETQLQEIASFLSFGHKVINRQTLKIEAYANPTTFNRFLTYGLDYEVPTEDNEFSPHANLT